MGSVYRSSAICYTVVLFSHPDAQLFEPRNKGLRRFPPFTPGLEVSKLNGGHEHIERFQGRGVYKALIKKRLDVISDLGIKLATSGTREKTSAPILKRIGFTAYRDEIFQYDHKVKGP